MEQLTGRTITRLHIVGGGRQNALLNQFAANAIRRHVVAGPAKATAAGNVLIQAIAFGHVDSLQGLRKIVRDSFALKTFEPLEPQSWQGGYQRFLNLTL